MRTRVGVLFGGQSAEHAVSMMSAKAVMEALEGSAYELVPIAITRDGRWLVGDSALALMSKEIGSGAEAAPAASEGEAVVAQGPWSPDRLRRHLDVIIPLLHGPLGEDGTVQGLFELSGIPYVGSGVLGSALGMDKIAMKTMLGAHQIPQVRYQACTRHGWNQDPHATIEHLEANLAYPMFVKPANLGSSVGVSKAEDREQLGAAMDLAQQYDRRIIVEEGIDAREFEVGVLGWTAPEASVVGEVAVVGHDFYNYEAKYQDHRTEMTIPAQLPSPIQARMQALAVQAFQVLDCAGLARVDFFWDQTSGAVLLNEVNTLPGFTPYSMYPLLWAATGVPYATLLQRLIDYALERTPPQAPES